MKKVIFVLLLIFLSQLHADYSHKITELHTRYSNLNTFEANIVQTNYFSMIDNSSVSNGKIYITKDTVILEYTAPAYQFAKLEGSKITVYSQAENTAVVSNETDANITRIMNLPNLISSEMRFVEKENDTLIFSMVTPTDNIRNLKIYVPENQNLISKISYSDTEDNTITIALTNQNFNRTLTKRPAQFVIPSGATTIEH